MRVRTLCLQSAPRTKRTRIFNTLSHVDMPSVWRSFHFGFWDWSFLIAPLGLFALLFLLLVRLVPAVSMFEMRELSHREGTA